MDRADGEYMEETTTPMLITADHVVALTGLSRTLIYREADTGDLPSVRIGRAVRFRPKDVEAWIEAHTRRVSA